MDPTIQLFGLSWHIFSQADMEEAIAIAQSCGFWLEHSAPIPACGDPTVPWYNWDYAFIALSFRKP